MTQKISEKDYFIEYPKAPEKFTAPLHLKITLAIGATSLLIHIFSRISNVFADFFTENIASVFRTILSTLTGWIPFSLAECFLFMLPIILVIYFSLTYDYYIRKNNNIRSLVFGMLSFALSLYSLAVFTFMTGYFNSTLDQKLDIKANEVSANELYDTAMKINGEINQLTEGIDYGNNDFSVMPYDIYTMGDKLIESYRTLKDKYPFIHNINAKIKPVCLSEAMSYTHITGVYTYFTGEANLDVNFPDYSLPFTAAHEFAHQRGIARENEANFIAFLVCINSDDPYIKYSGYTNMLQYVSNALYSADKTLYQKLKRKTDANVNGEFAAYSLFFNKYRNSQVSKISGTINDTYLKLQGTEGTKSYGMVVDLAVAYYKDK